MVYTLRSRRCHDFEEQRVAASAPKGLRGERLAPHILRRVVAVVTALGCVLVVLAVFHELRDRDRVHRLLLHRAAFPTGRDGKEDGDEGVESDVDRDEVEEDKIEPRPVVPDAEAHPVHDNKLIR